MFNWGSRCTLEIGHHSLDVVSYGPPPEDALTLVLLHEGLGCIELWHDFPQQLAASSGCGVLVYSRAGYGRSSPADLPRPLDYMSREAHDVLALVLDRVNAQRVALIGHSDGASIAAIYAGSIADYRIRALTLIAPHFFTELIAVQAITKAMHKFTHGDLKARLEKYHVDAENAFYGWCNAWLDPQFIDWNITECIDYWRMPVLAIQGSDDQYGTLAQIEEIQQRCYSPVETHILNQCQHAPHLEKTEQTLDSIVEFIARLERMEG